MPVKGKYPDCYTKYGFMPTIFNADLYTVNVSDVIQGSSIGGGDVYASGNNVMTGNNTFSGNTTFTTLPTITVSIDDSSPSNVLVDKDYVDSNFARAVGGDYASLTDDNTYTGTNSFTLAPTTTQTIDDSFPSTTIIPKSYADYLYNLLLGQIGSIFSSSNTYTGNNTFQNQVDFQNGLPTNSTYDTPTQDYQLVPKSYVDSQDKNLQSQITQIDNDLQYAQSQISTNSSNVVYVSKDNSYGENIKNNFNGDCFWNGNYNISFNGSIPQCNLDYSSAGNGSLVNKVYVDNQDYTLQTQIYDNNNDITNLQNQINTISSSPVLISENNSVNPAYLTFTDLGSGNSTNTLITDYGIYANTYENRLYAGSVSVNTVYTDTITYSNNFPSLTSSNIGYQTTIYIDWNNATYYGTNGLTYAYPNDGTNIALAYNISKHLTDLPNGMYMFVYNYFFIPSTQYQMYLSFGNDRDWDSYPADYATPPTDQYYNNSYNSAQTWYNVDVCQGQYTPYNNFMGQLTYYSAMNPGSGITPCLRCLKQYSQNGMNVNSSSLTVIRVA